MGSRWDAAVARDDGSGSGGGGGDAHAPLLGDAAADGYPYPVADASLNSTAGEGAPQASTETGIGADGTFVGVPKHLQQNSLATSVSMMKAIVGAGSFGLPWAVMQAGTVGGLVLIPALGLWCAFTITTLIWVKNQMVEKERRVTAYPTYARVVYAVLPGWPGKVAGVLLSFTIFVMSIGACGAYLVFCCNLITQMAPAVPRAAVAFGIAVPLMAISYLRSFKWLAITSLIGDVALLIGFTAVVVYGGVKSPPRPFDTYPYLNLASVPLAIGPAAFLFATHMLQIPLEVNMKKREQFSLTLYTSYAAVIVTNTAFAVVAYLFFGADTKDIVVENLTEPFSFVPDLARVALVLDLVFTYSIVFVPGRDTIEVPIVSPLATGRAALIKRIVVRSVLVVLTAIIGTFVVQFGSLLGVLAGVAIAYMSFILPSFLYLSLLWRDRAFAAKGLAFTLSRVMLHGTSIVAGLAIAVLTTWQSIASLLPKGD